MATKTTQLEAELNRLVASRTAHHRAVKMLNDDIGILMAKRAKHEDAIFELRDRIYIVEQQIIDTSPPPTEHP